MNAVKKALTILYIPSALLSLFILVQSCLLFGPLYIGNLAPLSIFLAFTYLWAYLSFLRFSLAGWKKALGRLLSLLCAAGFAFLTGLTVWMGSKAYSPSPLPEDSTVVVLGCQVRPDGRVSRMLAGRLDKAADFLLEHPDVPCVVSGGKGLNEPGAEACYMRVYLLEKGVEDERIYTEPHSMNTSQNLAFSREILLDAGLPRKLILVTDGFHQARAGYFASRLGLDAAPLSSTTPWYLLPLYVLREHMALAKAFFLHA